MSTKRIRAKRYRRESFLDKCLPVPFCGCWLWLGSGTQNGYGHFYYEGRVQLAHRASFEIFNGEIPDGLLVCHKCDTPACVNPDHLFTGTYSDNARDSINKNRKPLPVWVLMARALTHCKRGHEFSVNNTGISHRGNRVCRACSAMHQANRRKKIALGLLSGKAGKGKT